ncbi:MAG TPA: peptidyl-prolyl cis-trans isomerase [Pyrinomonadaceae bacterium]|nr:peptidyl-prolyl cis-trans isomerase [Pyrinomonadaceae bacterium]HMP65934.1 peptidyl-prolyl cis-trans isomerase [Pyrinomonadaceae bacterium]
MARNQFGAVCISIVRFGYHFVLFQEFLMSRIPKLLAFVFAFALFTVPALAQETEERVVDEVVAQVNDGVITLSKIRREIKMIVDSRIEQGRSRDEAQREVEEKQGELIANLINEELLVQRAKELGMEREIEAAVNARFLELMRSNNLTTLDSLYTEMRNSGVDPDMIREEWRKQVTREQVIRQEVQLREYWRPTSRELQDYFNKNKEKFTKPETVTLSEIFLSFAGRTEASVREKAADLVAQLRNGADFVKMVAENSDRQGSAQNNGRVDTFVVTDLDPKIANAIKDLKAGQYSEPIDMDQVGVTILRIDERTAASSESHFDENAIRLAIMNERYPEAIKKFMSSLREDSYIKINDSYRPLVAPILYEEERRGRSGN